MQSICKSSDRIEKIFITFGLDTIGWTERLIQIEISYKIVSTLSNKSSNGLSYERIS